jgi:hypothetical protein
VNEADHDGYQTGHGVCPKLPPSSRVLRTLFPFSLSVTAKRSVLVVPVLALVAIYRDYRRERDTALQSPGSWLISSTINMVMPFHRGFPSFETI